MKFLLFVMSMHIHTFNSPTACEIARSMEARKWVVKTAVYCVPARVIERPPS